MQNWWMEKSRSGECAEMAVETRGGLGKTLGCLSASAPSILCRNSSANLSLFAPSLQVPSRLPCPVGYLPCCLYPSVTLEMKIEGTTQSKCGLKASLKAGMKQKTGRTAIRSPQKANGFFLGLALQCELLPAGGSRVLQRSQAP